MRHAVKPISHLGLSILAIAVFLFAGLPAAAQSCGVSWTAATPTTGNTLRGVAYGNGLYVAVGDNGTIITSPDGVYWTSQVSGVVDNLQAVIYAGGQWVIVGGKTIFWSTDGKTFNRIGATAVTDLQGLTWGNGKYVAVGKSGGVINSTDGKTWYIRYNSGPDLYAVHFANGKYVLVGQWGNTAISSDGDTFTQFWVTPSTTLRGITFGGGTWICVGDNGYIFTSPDGQIWTTADSHTGNNLFDITYGAGTFIAAGKTGVIRYSYNGFTWNPASPPSQADLDGTCWGLDRFLVTGGVGTVLRSICIVGYDISGRVTTDQGAGLQGVQINLSGGATKTTQTGSDGTYTFANVTDGSYTVTPTMAGFSFVPSSRSVIMSGQDLTGQDFVQHSAVDPPTITNVMSAGNPFRLKVYGGNFHPNCTVKIATTGVTTQYKNAGYLVAKNCKSYVPKGSTVQITVVNNDDGGVSAPYSFTR